MTGANVDAGLVKLETDQEPVVVAPVIRPAMDLSGLMLSSLPKFDGSSSERLRRFLDDFERFARIQDWDENKKKDWLPFCLSGAGREAFEAIPQTAASSFTDIKSALEASFSKRSALECHLVLQQLKFQPGVIELDVFVIHFKKALSRAFPGQEIGPMLFNHFLTTLPPEYVAAVVADGITTFERAVDKVRNVRAAGTLAAGAAAPVRRVDGDEDEVRQLRLRVEQLERQLAGSIGAGGGPSGTGTQSSRGPGSGRQSDGGASCFVCGRRGHLARVCRLRFAHCFQCGEQGHIASVCQGNSGRPADGSSVGAGRVLPRGPPPPRQPDPGNLGACP